MIIVTGGAGFIGSNLVRELNRRGVEDIIIIDRLDDSLKFKNLTGTKFADYMDKDDFRVATDRGTFDVKLDVIFHQGACADTMERDGAFMMANNYAFSKLLLHFALSRRIPFIYASSAAVYGDSSCFSEDWANESPLNVYAFSKWAFDQHVRTVLSQAESTVVGCRYFNVYGRNEHHKGRMASIIHQFHSQALESGSVRVFGESAGYAAGEQRRDFIYVGDVVDVNLFFAAGPTRKGIFNVGTGESRTFNSVANAVIEAVGGGAITYVPFPAELSGRYQSFTQADVTRLRATGYQRRFTSLEDGVRFTLGEHRSVGAVAV